MNYPDTEQGWDNYRSDLAMHNIYCDAKKPKRPIYLTEQAYQIDYAEWEKMRSMDAPNPPNYYRANND
jgi:hypothetical protein